MTDINRTKQSYQHKHNGKIDPQSVQSPPVLHSTGPNASEHARTATNGAGSGSGGSLKRNNSHHQRLKKSNTNTLEREYGGTHHNHHQHQQTGPRSGAGSGLAKSWSKTSSSSTSQSTTHGPVDQTPHALETGTSASGRPPGTNAGASATQAKTEATLGEDFKRFHTLRNSYGGKSNLNVNNTDHTIKSQVLLHQQKLREYSRQLPSQQQPPQHHDNDSYSTCSSSQSDYQHPQQPQPHQHHRHKHHTHYRLHQHQHHQQPPSHGVVQPPIYPISATVAATATLTRAGGGGSILKNATGSSGTGHQDPVGSRNSLKRGPGGLSTLSLCSCDAETEDSLVSPAGHTSNTSTDPDVRTCENVTNIVS
uniref:Uncharacterized protein n=1 Tax=Anopheles dirus TaxID=7168 RepID=A0A182NMJ6_9DIPT